MIIGNIKIAEIWHDLDDVVWIKILDSIHYGVRNQIQDTVSYSHEMADVVNQIQDQAKVELENE